MTDVHSSKNTSEQEVRLLKLSKQYFGFTSFREHQLAIMNDVIAGRDVLALLPTGGGKSLCFQLPSLMLSGLTVVISPLIALMKDQVDGLHGTGIPATFLNSSIKGEKARARLRGLHAGEYRLLYLAPERVLLDGMLEDLIQWKVALFAIDEAHCISEWGHDFRPEYRGLSMLRKHFPKTPMLALTATATGRVREDIIQMLRLQDVRCYVASFNRPNLRYNVVRREGGYGQLLAFIQAREGDSGIVYCQSRKTSESLAEKLSNDGVLAVSYHAGLTPTQRTDHQDQFLRDESRVVCATIAFGMGINKPNVRFVVHYDLPKNLEGYYQETGRAGRDGLPSECLLLFSAGDVVKYDVFIREKTDEQERLMARKQLQQVLDYAESSKCRRVKLLAYFGETYEATHCGSCDNCVAPRELFDGTVAAQKFLSCVYRIKERSGVSFGLAHTTGVLTGSKQEKILTHGHDQLSTYGIGGEHDASRWAQIGRELIQLGYLRQIAERWNVLELTAEGLAVLKERKSVMLTSALTNLTSEGTATDQTLREKSVKLTRSKMRTGGSEAMECDEDLFEQLRALRRSLAQERSVQSYIIFSDVSLRQMARHYPQTEGEMLDINGVGAKKWLDFGQIFIDEIRGYLMSHPRIHFKA